MPGPMQGYKIIDLSQIVSGPLATMLFADQGAEVIKVEQADSIGDMTRLPSFASGGIAALYANNNRGKRSIALDLTTDAGRSILCELVAEADVVVQNFRPGAVERLGIAYDDLVVVRPDLVYCSISGFGPTGPYSGQPVLDPVIQGIAGVIGRQCNPADGRPDLVRNLFADKSTALTVAQAITAALLVRERTGDGQHIEVPMLDACVWFHWPDGMMDHTMLDDPTPGVLLAEIYTLTDAADGQFVYIATNNTMRHSLYRAVGHPEWCDDPRFSTMEAAMVPENFRAIDALLRDVFRTMPLADILDRLRAADVPCGPILSPDEVIADPQIVHNGTLETWVDPVAGRIRQPRPAARFSRTPATVAASLSTKGADTDAILAELGHNPDDIAQLRADGVVV